MAKDVARTQSRLAEQTKEAARDANKDEKNEKENAISVAAKLKIDTKKGETIYKESQKLATANNEIEAEKHTQERRQQDGKAMKEANTKLRKQNTRLEQKLTEKRSKHMIKERTLELQGPKRRRRLPPWYETWRAPI